MQALFHVDNIYRDTDKTKLVLQGNVIEGNIHSNATLLIPLNRTLDVTSHIDAVELDTTQNNRFRIYIKCDDADEVDILIALNLTNETFIVIDNPA